MSGVDAGTSWGWFCNFVSALIMTSKIPVQSNPYLLKNEFSSGLPIEENQSIPSGSVHDAPVPIYQDASEPLVYIIPVMVRAPGTR